VTVHELAESFPAALAGHPAEHLQALLHQHAARRAALKRTAGAVDNGLGAAHLPQQHAAGALAADDLQDLVEVTMGSGDLIMLNAGCQMDRQQPGITAHSVFPYEWQLLPKFRRQCFEQRSRSADKNRGRKAVVTGGRPATWPLNLSRARP